MSTLAAIRPHSWDLPLILHILGAMVLVGSLFLCVVSLVAAWRSNSPALTRLGFRALSYGAFSGWIVMRVGAEWIANKEGLDNDDISFTWLDIGRITADTGFLLLLISTIIGGIVVRRLNRGEAVSATSTRIAAALLSLLLIAYLVTVWAMTAKPT